MGVKYLNSFLNSYTFKGRKLIHLSELSGKKISIDISIYLYKYKSQDALFEKIFLLCSVLKKYNIIPLIIFDGKITEKKREELELRKIKRQQAENSFKNIMTEINENKLEMTDKIKEKILLLKRQLVKISKNDISNVKKLITGLGIKYIDAIYEADSLCSELVLKKKVDACLSDDTDMFVYGCTKVLRNINLNNHTVMLYNRNTILNELDISLDDFKWMCILSSTDYLKFENNIFKNYLLYTKYKKNKKKLYLQISFIEWYKNKGYIDDLKLKDCEEIYNLYNLEKNNTLKNYKYMLINYIQNDLNLIKNILKLDRFIFA